MGSDDSVWKQFVRLEEQAKGIRLEPRSDGASYIDPGVFKAWEASAADLLRTIFGNDSNIYREFVRMASRLNKVSTFNALLIIFQQAKSNYEAGFPFNLQNQLSGEILGDFIALAERAIEEGQKDVAAVLIYGALEDVLKRYAISQGLDVSGKTMEEVINAIKGKGLISGATKTELDGMPRKRNHALHGDWDKVTPESVSSTIGFTKQFIRERLK